MPKVPLATLFGKIKRISPDGDSQFFTVTDYKVAEYMYSLQDHGYTFIVINESGNTCVSCEG